MATLRYDARIAKSPDEVWALVADSSRLADWFDGIDSVVVDDENRTLQLSMGITLVERIVTVDPALRRFQYSIIEGIPVTGHLGTVDVLEDGNGSRVVYSTECSDDFAPIMGPSTEAGLNGLKKVLEG
jgi:carbon monoxide dehydrogenase subunit G